MRAFTLALGGLILATMALDAHPVPRDNHDRTLIVVVDPQGVRIDYRVELDDYRMYRDLDGVLLKRQSGESIHDAYLRHWIPILQGNLVVRLDGQEIPLTCTARSFQVLDHVRCDYQFQGRWHLTSGKEYRFSFVDLNFQGDTTSKIHLTLDVSPELTMVEAVTPEDDLLNRPVDQLGPGERDRLRKLSGTIRAVPSFQAGRVRPTLPPDLDPMKPGARGRKKAYAAVTKPAGGVDIARIKANGPEAVEQARTHWQEILFDSKRGIGLLLLMFVGFGAGHALTPGHGKTLVAAYLVGERGTVWHALILGLVTTLTHTGIVMVIALALPYLFPKAPPAVVQGLLGLVGGVLIAGVGLWLLLQRLAGRADHVHLGGGHSHSHGEDGAEATSLAPGMWGIVLLGISGGIVPCWDAMLIPAVCVAAQRPTLAWPLVLAFSAGLAGVLVLLGIVVVRTKEYAGRTLDSRKVQWLTTTLPLLSSIIIVMLGLWMGFESVRLLT